MNDRAMSKYRVSSSRTSSESRDSDSAVKPTRSAKRTETRRRSVARSPASAVVDALKVEAEMPESGEPHSPQNFIQGVFGFAHEGQTTARERPHSPQNLRPASFSNPQFVQIILFPGRRSGRGPAKGTASIRD